MRNKHKMEKNRKGNEISWRRSNFLSIYQRDFFYLTNETLEKLREKEFFKSLRNLWNQFKSLEKFVSQQDRLYSRILCRKYITFYLFILPGPF